MSPPARNAALPQEGAPGTARWLNMVTTMVLGAAALIVGVVAIPSVLRAVAGTPSGARDFAPPVRAQNPPIVSGEHPGSRAYDADPDDDSPAPRGGAEPPGMRLPSLRPNDPRVRAPRFPGDREGQQDLDREDAPPPLDDLGLPGGVTKRPLALRDRRTNAVIQELAAGAKVHILREDGEWVLVVKGGDADVVTGWAKRKELLLR
jgi:hypothetical protein